MPERPLTPMDVPFVIEGPLVPYTRMTKRSMHRDPKAQKYLAFKDKVGHLFKETYPGFDPWPREIPLMLEAVITHPFLMSKGKRKWDIINILKGIEDGLNKIAWTDDWQVIHYNVRSLVTDRETATIQIYPL